MSIDLEELKIQGTKMNYYFICKRKLWLFSKGITMEQNSDRVLSGKLIHEKSYPRLKKRDILIDDIINIDIIDGDFVREVKLSSKMTKADEMQLLYYLYYLKKIGIEKKGLLNYVKEKKQEVIELTEERSKEVEFALEEINILIKRDNPPKLIKLPYCTKCAYYEFCFVKEE
jgi:CRISPR-associated exonuclease Cas4